MFPGKLRSRWSGPFTITKVFPFGAVELRDEKTNATFKVNGQLLKHYYSGEDFISQRTSVELKEPEKSVEESS